jgi:hypothetical protein
MEIDSHIFDAIQIVISRDLLEENLADAIIDQARQLSGIDWDQLWEDHLDIH